MTSKRHPLREMPAKNGGNDAKEDIASPDMTPDVTVPLAKDSNKRSSKAASSDGINLGGKKKEGK